MILKTTYGKVSPIISRASSLEAALSSQMSCWHLKMSLKLSHPLPKIGPKLDTGQFQPVRR